eukprot:CAMPEP_0113972762 /NCGR_PEP_ID=MMETSP0011_2-20120614/13784_1 /TAXON_ID=101924 /ORGANISM="Rhodosorus marinus" /LENGTH=295 /DNA_ID=CAMNT_0000990029 /DNA_START=106 /DNA_END=993 /DNA_ORIENTATION=- /assembly_acc=CAM_ASM_000156
MVMFGQIVVGPPGSGKSTYCAGMQQFYKAVGRQCAVVNLDPANENALYDVAVDIKELVKSSVVAEEHGLGPNGSLMYCMEVLEANTEWLIQKTRTLKGQYLIFDFPGQVELFTHTTIVRSIVQTLVKHDYRLTAVNLVDSHYCSDPGKYISALMLSLTTMLQLEDQPVYFATPEFPLETLTEVADLGYVLDRLKAQSRTQRFTKLNEAIAGVLESYNFVHFLPLNIEVVVGKDKDTLVRVSNEIDKSNGYTFGHMDIQKFLYAHSSVHANNPDWDITIRERYMEDFKDRSEDGPS